MLLVTQSCSAARSSCDTMGWMPADGSFQNDRKSHTNGCASGDIAARGINHNFVRRLCITFFFLLPPNAGEHDCRTSLIAPVNQAHISSHSRCSEKRTDDAPPDRNFAQCGPCAAVNSNSRNSRDRSQVPEPSARSETFEHVTTSADAALGDGVGIVAS